MDTSRTIASIMGPTIMAATALESVNFHIFDGIHPTTVFNNGLAWFMGGLATVRFHNMWVRDWRVLVTLLGWVSIFAGLSRMGFPDARQPDANPGTYIVIGLLFFTATLITWKAYRTKG
ncbi:MAG: hypothetical protein AAFY84_01675 [Pseudomonadota bacterium]